MRPAKRKPDAGGRRASDAISVLRALYGRRNDTGTIALTLAARAVSDARLHLGTYADGTDAPACEAVEAADLLDAVADLLPFVEQREVTP